MTAIGLVLIIFSLWFIWVTDNNTSGATIASQSNTGGNMYLKELFNYGFVKGIIKHVNLN